MNSDSDTPRGSIRLPIRTLYLWCALAGTALLALTQALGLESFQDLDGANAVSWVMLFGGITYAAGGAFLCRGRDDFQVLMSQVFGSVVSSTVLMTGPANLNMFALLLVSALPCTLFLGYKVAKPHFEADAC